jgi:hypothetical protein
VPFEITKPNNPRIDFRDHLSPLLKLSGSDMQLISAIFQ